LVVQAKLHKNIGYITSTTTDGGWAQHGLDLRPNYCRGRLADLTALARAKVNIERIEQQML
jgi:hypothetical protein